MTGLLILFIYVALFAGTYFAIRTVRAAMQPAADFNSLKTVTFGDESAVRADRAASVVSLVVVFLVWGAFTGSKLVPVHVPGPFVGYTSFTYTSTNDAGQTSDATVNVLVHETGAKVDTPDAPAATGFAQGDAATVAAWRSVLIRAHRNDGDGAKTTAVEGQAIAPGETVKVPNGSVTMTAKGSLNFSPNPGLQMEPIWMPPPEDVVSRLVEIASNGYQNAALFEHVGWSLWRVFAGFVLGTLIGVPLGYAMGLSGWARGWFDPIVEFMRPVPPLALIPLVIIWFGIGENGKVVLLFLAALWVMIIAARAGVSGVNITKVQAAYSLGASKWQVLRHVIVPNSLPEIFTGARVAMGVCWGTVVAAELVAAEKGAGKMIVAASKFQATDIVIMGIVIIGLIGFGIDILMRRAETILVPWKGRS
ncbi:ABC transporter permease subunit [Epibacterium sp. SM1979]|uniref:ABC transporter permease subunit n=1 Tax=Tritonibacter litoralis TaxID=2662264 RepID=A0A843YDS0_9RHOB|nr:ABC transporter permease subunit [Tritonibacter litoralis]MQQ09061.1 ABC transporter permease subunit [Tritonibacter litoralis]